MPKGARKSGDAPAKIMAGSNKSGKKSVSKSQRAGLTFPVARINRFMKNNSGTKRIGGSAPVYMTAVVEFITADLMDLAGNCANEAGRKTVTPADLTTALRGDVDLAKVFAGHGIFVSDKSEDASVLHTLAAHNKRTARDAALSTLAKQAEGTDVGDNAVLQSVSLKNAIKSGGYGRYRPRRPARKVGVNSARSAP